MHGHLWTIGPRLAHALRRARPDGSRPWSAAVPDDRWGSVRISGRFDPGDGDELLVVVHGLGGSSESHYMGPFAAAARAAGMAVLRLELRGSDLSGEDLYHAGLTADVAAALACPEAAGARRVYLAGFSLGGHVALRYATDSPDPRVRAVAAVCAPLDLAAAQGAIDAPAGWLYRRYLLTRLRRLYLPIWERRRLPASPAEVARIRTIRAWDEAVVVPRWGFRNADDYYARASVGPRLDRLAVPGLLLAAEADPMVPRAAVAPALAGRSAALEVRLLARGGHVGFPRDLDLGLAGGRGVDEQVLRWLRAKG